MIILDEARSISICLEGFLYGKLCALTCTLAKEVQLFLGLGFYSGIFAMYLQCLSQKTGTAIILFYAVCLLYVLSGVSFASDIVALVFYVSNNSICEISFFCISRAQTRFRTLSPQLQTDLLPMLSRISIIQATVGGFCDFLGQCILVRRNHCTYHPSYWCKYSKIYRCWIVWGQNIRVVIIPSFLAIAFLGRSSYPQLRIRFQLTRVISRYLASDRWHINVGTKPGWDCYLGDHDEYNKCRHVHGCQCPGDGLDCFQDPQGVLASQT